MNYYVYINKKEAKKYPHAYGYFNTQDPIHTGKVARLLGCVRGLL
jgi:hypothetical protein